LVAGSVIVALGLGLWLFMRPHGAADAKGKDVDVPPLVTVIIPTPGNVLSTVSLTGQISAQNDMPIGVEGEGGRIAAVLVEPGDRVQRGQVLARLNPLTAQSQVLGAEALLDELRADAAAAQAEFARAEGAREAFSAEEFDRRRTSALTAQSKVKLAEAQLDEARTRRERTTVVAPSDGTVLTRSAEVGQIATPGATVLFHLANRGAIEMRGAVAEQDMPRLKVGQSAEVRLEGITAPFAGKVWQVGAVIDQITRQGTVRIALPAADQNLRPGAFARADIQAGTVAGVIVPQTAVLSDEQGSYTLIVGAGDKVERRAVRVGGAHSEGLVISGGLNGNERVVAIAGAFLRPGEQVSVAPTSVAGGGSGKGVPTGGANALVNAP
jgi:RND family efflux transporter MFP subunit